MTVPDKVKRIRIKKKKQNKKNLIHPRLTINGSHADKTEKFYNSRFIVEGCAKKEIIFLHYCNKFHLLGILTVFPSRRADVERDIFTPIFHPSYKVGENALTNRISIFPLIRKKIVKTVKNHKKTLSLKSSL